MSLSLPPEIFDLIVEHLCEEQAALKVCCVVAKSWVPRARSHLFARVGFHHIDSPLESWVKAFPDPSNSPAHHTRHLSIRSLPGVVVARTVAHAWIRAFRNIVSLIVETTGWDDTQASLAPLHAISSTLKSLWLVYNSIPSSEVFDLVFSFPSLEGLTLMSIGGGETDVPALPSTSPKFTGTLCLARRGGVRFDIWPLLALPGGLRFSTVWVGCIAEDFESIAGLVSACCDTLEFLTIMQYFPSAFLLAHQLMDISPPSVDPDASSASALLDLSRATNLKKVVFQFGRPSVLWAVMALQTIKSKNLQHITIHQDTGPYRSPGVEEGLLPEWRDLDHLLVQFWTSHSIRPKLVDGMTHLRDLTPTLFLELTRRGLLDIV